MLKKFLIIYTTFFLLSCTAPPPSKEEVWMEEAKIALAHYYDMTKSEILYKLQSCEKKKNPYCSSILGGLYFDEKKFDQAYIHFVKSQGVLKATNGYAWAPSEYALGVLSEMGVYFQKDKHEAIKHYKKCAETGTTSCIVRLATLYQNEVENIKKEAIEHNVHLDTNSIGYILALRDAYAWTVISLNRSPLIDRQKEETVLHEYKKIMSDKEVEISLNAASYYSRNIQLGNPFIKIGIPSPFVFFIVLNLP